MGARVQAVCVHCGATETPLWRAGPEGPKTLCNACGVRWKKTGSVARRRAVGAGRVAKPARARDAAPAVRRERAADLSPRGEVARPPSPRKEPLEIRAPVPVVRVAATGRAKYESVFSGLMAVRNPGEGRRARVQTEKGRAYFGEFREGGGGGVVSGGGTDEGKRPGVVLRPVPSPSPPPGAAGGSGGVYVTEVHAPSPSPSPPPMPRMQREPESGGFRLLLAAAADDTDPSL